jgi:hypothetical protein
MAQTGLLLEATEAEAVAEATSPTEKERAALLEKVAQLDAKIAAEKEVGQKSSVAERELAMAVHADIGAPWPWANDAKESEIDWTNPVASGWLNLVQRFQVLATERGWKVTQP